MTNCFCRSIECCGVIRGKHATKRKSGFLAVFLVFYLVLLMSWSVALQLSVRWAAALYSQAGDSAAALVSVYPIILLPFICKCWELTHKGQMACVLLLGLICPLAVLFVFRPVSGSDYLRVLTTDFLMRNSRCYFDFVYSDKRDSFVALLQRIGL